METRQPVRNRPRAIVLTASVLGLAGVMAAAGVVVGRRTAGSGDTAMFSARQIWHGWSEPGGSRPGGAGAAYGWSGATDPQPERPTTADANQQQVTGLVRIVARSKYDGSTDAGTGMVLTRDGEVVTNNHVVEDATSIHASVVGTGKSYAVRLLGTDKTDDVAVLQLVGATGLDTVKAATGGSVGAGDAVTAVGDAEGVRRLSAATGTVVGLRRSITTDGADGTSSEQLKGLIEIDADVVPGDSGGAVRDALGDVIGMTTAASTGGADLTGYAIPIAKALHIVHQVDTGTETARVHLGYSPFLGVQLASDSVPTIVRVLQGTPAFDAGLVPGDRIAAVDGSRVSTANALRRAIAAHQPGETIRIRWVDAAGTGHSAAARLVRGPIA